VEYKHREALERGKEPWLQEHETKTNIVNKMFVQIIHMKSMVATKEFRRQKVEKKKE
jgi:hypothetical protein